jgi:prephenate dehydratase
MPFQNTIHGVVTETLDCLLDLDPESNNAEAGPSSARADQRPVIVADLDLPIRHCLVARRGVKMEDIRWVRSHEQVSMGARGHGDRG